MKTTSSRNLFTVLLVAFAACLFVTVTGWLLASPADDISQAVAANGKKDVKAADADSFVDAFTSVLVGVEETDSPAYIAAAKKLRPDLADRISAAAADVDSAPESPDTGDDRRVSRHRHRVRICCVRDTSRRPEQTITIPASKARQFLATHPNCRRGPCPYSTPPPHA